MSLSVMMSLDLKKADSNQRKIFDKKMAEEGWDKSTPPSTTYKVTFESGATLNGIKQTVEEDILAALTEAKIKKCTYEYSVSTKKPISGVVTR